MWILFMVIGAGGMLVRCAPALDDNAPLDGDTKALEDENNSESSDWDESTMLLSTTNNSTLCNTENSLIADPKACDKYFRCQNGVLEHYKCFEGFLFDVKRKKCLFREITTCAKEVVVDPCCRLIDGLYPNYTSNCKQYYRCAGGRTVEEQSCSAGMAFSYHSLSCLTESEVACVQPHCEGDNHDLMILPSSGCRAYYFCLAGTPASFVCPRGHIFSLDLKKCVESGVCYESLCMGKINGDYADTTHECKRYFRCSGGRISEVFSCPKGKKYNGQECVEAGFVNCEKPEATAIAMYVKSEDQCEELKDGLHFLPGSDCRSSVTCMRGRTVARVECSEEQRFNGGQCAHRNVTPCNDYCSLKADGYYADEKTECREYYLCTNGRVIKRELCTDGSLYNGRMCVPAGLTSCRQESAEDKIQPCVGLSDGIHANYLSKCEDYFYCSNHEMLLRSSCRNGMAWNGKSCVRKTDFLCKAPEPWAGCSGLSTGLYQDKASGCVNYFYCHNGQRSLLSCSAGQVYDGEACVDTAEYTCPGLEKGPCTNESDGYRQDELSGCRSYFYCSQGQKITYVCSGSFVFNGTDCVSPKEYDCPFKYTDCVNKHNGYHADESSGCRKYYYCFGEEKITTISCNGKKVYDGNRCVVATDPKTTCSNAVYNPCRGKTDDRHVDIASECKRYYTCQNEIKVMESTCANGTKFNGATCVQNFDCGLLDESHCQDLKIGFHQDLASNCRKYYFCVGSQKTKINCPEGKIFNGALCVPQDSYTCPTKHS